MIRRIDKIRKALFMVSLVFMILSIAASSFFYIKIRERDRLLEQLIHKALDGKNLTAREETVLAISREVYRIMITPGAIDPDRLDIYERWESTSFFNITSAVCLKYNGYGIKGHWAFGSCGSMPKVVLNCLWRLGIPARKLSVSMDRPFDSHTMLEYYDQGKWRVLSPADQSFFWRNPDGSVASVQDIKGNEEVFKQIYNLNPKWRYNFKVTRNIRWEKLPPWMISVFRWALGEERFLNATTPAIYEKPRTLFFIISLTMAGFFSALAVLMKILEIRSRNKINS